MDYTDILTKIRRIIRSVNLESKRIEKEYGISIPQLLALNYLKTRNNFQASHKEIKDYLQLNASTITGIISRLEKKGLVARLPKQNDRRVGMITITARGAELLGKTPAALHERLSIKLQTVAPEQLQKLQDSFDTIINFLEIEDLEAAPIFTDEVNEVK
ncbi:MAG: MarR family transcriptional regulator [Bacteroidetes bacterium]|nr:MarR family transcriptional regulator [Bacteroidota bacterium]MCB0846055.1 MarR family transcriptional regulator [Bacteroidota bacterium]MCB0853502.1 MarR family transcriptional regulator [Bacteroidota bacterium]